MAVTSFASGSQAATVTTEYEYSVNEPGTYVLRLDLSAMAAGDVFVIRAKARVLTGGTTRLLWEQRIDDPPLEYPIIDSLPVSTDLSESNGLVFSVTQSDGTSRTFIYKILKHA